MVPRPVLHEVTTASADGVVELADVHEFQRRIAEPALPDTPALSDGWARFRLTGPTSRGKTLAPSSRDRPELAINDDPPPRQLDLADRQLPHR
jgi:hypothetical protein